MIITMSVQATPEILVVHVPHIMLTLEQPNVVAYNERTKKIVAVGKTAETMQHEAPTQWEAHKANINFVHPFDVHVFRLDCAIAVLNYYTFLAYGHIRKGAHAFWFLIDTFDYDLSIRGYETLPHDIRTRFARELRQSRRVHTLRINGQ